MVFVSRLALSVYRNHSVAFANGGSLVPVGLKSVITGGLNGNSLTPIARCSPPSHTIGNGSPQYRCRLNNQSRNLYVIVFFPTPASSKRFAISSFASPVDSPSNGPLLTANPSPTKHSIGSFSHPPPPTLTRGVADTTSRIGSPNFVANSQSRMSCPGTAIIAPVPYPANT